MDSNKNNTTKNTIARAMVDRYSIDARAANEILDMTVRNKNGTTKKDNEPMSHYPVLYGYEGNTDNKIALMQPTQNINNIYKDDGGFQAVMDSKRQSPNFPRYEKIARAIYDNSAKYAGQPWNYDSLVKYNDTMSKNEEDRVVPILNGGQLSGTIAAGTYNPRNDSVNIDRGGIDDRSGTLRHEIVHSAQGLPRYADSATGNMELYRDIRRGEYNYLDELHQGKPDKYSTSPTELHANVAGALQALRAKGVKLNTEKDIDEYINKILPTDEYLSSKPITYDNDGNRVVDKETDMLLNALSRNKIIYQGMQKKNISPKLILKALIMTTAKNEQQVPNQQNSAIDNGIDIS